ncbi:MAG: hypothetical protein JJE04_00720 [Acidobacteriia bacterium]|nr:hypothetical protein [Terriglobia bacterium]
MSRPPINADQRRWNKSIRAYLSFSVFLCGCQMAVWAADVPAQFAITEASLHQYEDGPALQGNHYFVPGEIVFLSFRAAGYKATETDPPKVKLSYRIDAFDTEGVLLVETKTDRIEKELAPQDKNWQPKVRYSFSVPPLGDPGTYRAVITVKDETGGGTAKRDLSLTVRGHAVEASPALVVRNFRFLRDEQEANVAASATYRAGDPIWARFDVTGYKIGEKNRFQVSYGLEVLRSSGESIYTEPKAAEESAESFYRRRYMPGELNLRPSSDIAKGDYTILLRVEDHLGGQKYESRHVFHIE